MFQKNKFEKHLESLRSRFDKQGYPKELVENQIRRILESIAKQLFERLRKTRPSVPLVVMYYSPFHNLNNTIRKLFIFLYVEE